MKKLSLRTKLSLNAETVRLLADRQLAQVAGGGWKSDMQGLCSYDENTQYSAYVSCTAYDNCTESMPTCTRTY